MADPEHVAIMQQGVSRWNEWRKDKDGRTLDLSEVDLRDRDLIGVDLRAMNLSGAVLRGTKLGKGTLLQDVNFSGADLFQADLRESNLQGADLSAAKGGLLSRQLAGADLTGAKLPEPLAKLYENLSSVKEISDSAQKLFLALLAGCLYSWLTIAQTTDVDLITNRASTPLPIIQAAIPIVGFYVVTPLILLCLYFYFHFYLQKLWEELGSLPAVFSDGRELHKRTDPWLLNDLVRSHFAKLKDGRPFLSYFQAWISVVLAWWLVPVTLFCFWLRFLRRHDLFWTIFHALLLALAIFSAVRLYSNANGTLRGEERPVFHWKDLVRRGSTYWRLMFAAGLGALLVMISLGAIIGEPYRPESRLQLQIDSPQTWVPWALDRAGCSSFANVAFADVSVKPPNWSGKKDEELDLVKGAHLADSNLRYANAFAAFLVSANLGAANMEHARLEYADLRNAYLGRALLRHAEMEHVDLRNALLISANLEDARLSGANLEKASLRTASLQKANLFDANVQSADLRGSDLTGVSFSFTKVQYADFRSQSKLIPTRGLTPAMITSAMNWRLAFYDPNMLKQLGLPPDHNEKLQKQMETEHQAKAATSAREKSK